MSSTSNAPNTAEVWSAHWRRNADAYLTEPLWTSIVMDRAKLAHLAPLLPEHGRIVEFGCGSGRLLRFAARRGLDAVGIDYSADALRLLREHAASDGVSVEAMQGDVRSTGLPDNSFDVVASTGLLEHFEDDDVVTIVREMVRVLRPGGLFYSDIVPAKFSLYRSLQQLTLRKPEVWERWFSRGDIEHLLIEAGLQDVSVWGGGVYPPIVPFLQRYEFVRRALGTFARATQHFWNAFDGTRAGDVLGFYYFATARKRVISQTNADVLPDVPEQQHK